ncbi:MAG: 5-formyltetrahydrofolate cyclo-ligase [Burkholderiales bacterium]
MTPRLLLAPVVGFDPQRYRLGYGGGYFDRTLAALGRPRTVIGVGYDSQALATIHPLAHDIPMDRIVTESGFRHEATPTELSSPACSLAEAPDAYAGYLDEAEIAAELRSLRASSDLADLAVTRALDQVLARLPSAPEAPPAVGSETPIADRVMQLRGRVRDDALHAALGEVLRLAQKAEKT